MGEIREKIIQKCPFEKVSWEFGEGEVSMIDAREEKGWRFEILNEKEWIQSKQAIEIVVSISFGEKFEKRIRTNWR